MSAFSVVIPASPFLRQRMAGLSGIARSVIEADLAGARAIYLVSPNEIAPEWSRSFAIRERALPEVIRVTSREQVSALAGETLLELPEDRLLTLKVLRELGDDPGSLTTAEGFEAGPPDAITKRIFQASMKSDEGWVIRKIDRPISTRIAALLLRLGNVTPNWVSLFCFAVAIAMCLVLAQGGAAWLAVGGAMLQVVMVIDCIDGDIARVTYSYSRFGAALDTTLDMLSNLGFLVALMIVLVRTYGWGQLAAPAAMTGIALVCAALMTASVRMGPGGGSFDVLRPALALRLAAHPRVQAGVLVLERMFKRDFYTLLFATLCIVGLAWLVPWIGLLGVLIWLIAILWCAPVIVADKAGDLLPEHLKAQ